MRKNRNRVCPVENAGMLDSFFRKWVQNPKKILADYVKPGMTVFDMGCGPGTFSIEIAKILGENGKVIAADLQEGMLEKVRSNIKNSRLKKIIKLHKCGANNLGINDELDVVLAFYVLHELPSQEGFFKEISQLMKEKGVLIIVEPRFHVIEAEFQKTINLAESLGFRALKKPKIFLSRAAVLGK